jgi:quercetin dioxygenase-like cupin family protein
MTTFFINDSTRNVAFLPLLGLVSGSYLHKQSSTIMQRRTFLTLSGLAALPLASMAKFSKYVSTKTAFVIGKGKSRFGDDIKFLGVHPNDLKISSKDTDGQLSVFDYTGLGKVGPALHVHFNQDEIFTVIEGTYRFVVGDETKLLGPGDTIFLPRNIPHTWIQTSEKGRLIYFLQPAGKMEEFFQIMNGFKEKPSQELIDRIHAEHQMKVVGPPLTL